MVMFVVFGFGGDGFDVETSSFMHGFNYNVICLREITSDYVYCFILFFFCEGNATVVWMERLKELIIVKYK
jgi:hypothetical protein